jgi:MoaD family protein
MKKMEIKVRYFAVFSQITGKRTENISLISGAKIRDLAKLLCKKYGREMAKHIRLDDKSDVLFLISGKQAELDSKLSDGNEIIISYPVGGG